MKILLVYTGSEQGSWGSIAFSRPQHYYIMPGILYCAAALRASALLGPEPVVACRFFNTTTQSEDAIRGAILEYNPDIIGFSCYSWNMEFHRRLMASIRSRLPGVLMVCGGPEVYFSSAPEVRSFFDAAPECDALLFGEAELRIAQLFKALAGPAGSMPSGLVGFAVNPDRFGGFMDFSIAQPVSLDEIHSPYPFDIEVELSPAAGRAMVYETVRGCPYKCIYCQFGHRSSTVRKFPLKRLHAELSWLLGTGVECLHVADSVFDLEARRACDFLSFFRDHNRRTSLFCYCSFVNLDEPLSRLFEETRAQIGVGVQSTNPETLRQIKRTIIPSRLIEKTPLLRKRRLNFYIDLMFGLPGDTSETFEKSFSDSVKLSPSFMMLFPLSLVRGTPLAENPDRFGVRPIATESLDLLCDIRYDHIALSTGFKAMHLERFDDMALACFYFCNRFALSLNHLIKRSPAPADTIAAIGKKTKLFLHSIGRKATNTDWLDGFQEAIHALFLEQLKILGAGPIECSAFEDLFKLDIYRILSVNAPQREKLFRRLEAVRMNPLYPQSYSAESGRAVYLATMGKMITCAYSWKDLCALEQLKEAIQPGPQTIFLHAAFEDWDARIFPMSPLERMVIGSIPNDRPISFDHLMSSVFRQAKRHSSGVDLKEPIVRAIETLAREGILYLSPGASQHSH
jgi:radical SAM superfamily enzyme YgiQ (UPF0313 family)